MKIFLSYASEDKNLAEPVYYALVNDGHEVFFDRTSLPPGGDYNSNIRKEIDKCELFIFLISGYSVTKKYTQTELKFAEKRWRSPKGAILPVMLAKTNYEAVPNYLKSITIFETSGNIAAEVADEVRRMGEAFSFVHLVSKHRNVILIVFAIIIVLSILGHQVYLGSISQTEEKPVIVLTREMLQVALAELERQEGPPASEQASDVGNLKAAIEDTKNIDKPIISASAETSPKWLQIAMAELGQEEQEGELHNPRILEYIDSAGDTRTEMGDELPWISYFVNWVFLQAGIQGTNRGTSSSWLDWGEKLDEPHLGCVAVFSRNQKDQRVSGVGFFLSETQSQVILLLGNSSNAVRISAIPKSIIRECRWPTGA